MTNSYDNLMQKNLTEIDTSKSFTFLTQKHADDLIKEQKKQQCEEEKNILYKHIKKIDNIIKKAKKRI